MELWNAEYRYITGIGLGLELGSWVKVEFMATVWVGVGIRRKVFRIGTVRYNWPTSAQASQAFSIAHCTDSEDLPVRILLCSSIAKFLTIL